MTIYDRRRRLSEGKALWQYRTIEQSNSRDMRRKGILYWLLCHRHFGCEEHAVLMTTSVRQTHMQPLFFPAPPAREAQLILASPGWMPGS